MADFQDILARLTANTGEGQSPGTNQAQNPIWAPQPSQPSQPSHPPLPQRQSYHQPSVSSPIFSPQPSGPQPMHASAIMSPNMPTSSSATPQPEGTSRANLLNLLKFASPGQETSRSSSSILNPQLDRGQSSSTDQPASFVSKPPLPSMLSRPDMKGESTTASSDNPQQFLLKLLNQRAPSQSSTTSGFGGRAERPAGEDQAVGAASDDKVQEILSTTHGTFDVASGTDTIKRSIGREEPPMRLFGSEEPDKPGNLKGSIFNYVNPFDQLSASSPRSRTPRTETEKDPLGPKTELLKHGRDSSLDTHDKQDFSISVPAPKLQKHSPGASREVTSRDPSTTGDGRTPLEALMGIDTKKDQHETPLQALGGVVEHESKQVAEVMSQLKIGANGHAQHENEKVLKSEKGLHDLTDEVQEVAKDMQEGLKDENTRKELEKSMPADVVEAVEETVEDLAQGVPEDWEDMDESAIPEPANRVFTFPMRPFHAIDIQPMHVPKPGLREGSIMDIARFKKDFDQLDRNLATATKSFIAYAALKHGGFRLIHQGSGKDKHVFRGPSNADRVFNIAMCSSSPPSQHADIDAVIATGLDGSVYWTQMNRSRGDGFDDDDLSKEGFVFPPAPATDDNTSGAQLKTRAKPSSRHPEYFAIGRGKSVYIVWPYTIRSRDFADQKTRIVDTAKYFRHHSCVISTGKAAKDFAFSEDDTVVVSLDKAGKMKFWDIREMVDSLSSVPTPPKGSVELRVPKLTFFTTPPNEKSWPTSIMFVDKERPYLKGGAIRYLIVGFKQNHTLQLWDLGLKKAVQELNFPHDNETDPICSLAYHPRTGVLALGHPTRNSIFLIHVSCPKYNLGHMSQAKYIQRLASQDSTLPGPESTAIMSGMRELSFASKGQLRSIGMQDKPIADNVEDEAMFELYVMHSKGVTCLTIAKSDIGWNKENKPINPVNGEQEGFITVRDLQPPPSAAPSEPSVNGDSLTPASGQKKSVKSSRASRTATPEATMRASGSVRHNDKQTGDVSTAVNGGDKTDKRSEERSVVNRPDAKAVNPSRAAGEPYSPAARSADNSFNASKSSTSKDIKPEAMPEQAEDVGSRSYDAADASKPLFDAPVVDVTRDMAREFSKTFNEQLEVLHRRLDEDKRVQDAASNAKQDAVLRLVSSTLTENTEKALNRIITTNIEKSLLPTVSNTTTKSLDQKLPQIVSEHLRSNLTKDLSAALAGAVSTAVQNPDVTRTMSEHLSGRLSDPLAGRLSEHLSGQLSARLSESLSKRLSEELSARLSEQLSARLSEQLSARLSERLSENLSEKITQSLFEKVNQRLSDNIPQLIERQMQTSLNQIFLPAFGRVAQQEAQNVAQTIAEKMETRAVNQLRKVETEREAERAQYGQKLDQLTSLVRGLSETVRAMANAQGTFQSEILKLQNQVAQQQPQQKPIGSERAIGATSRAATEPEIDSRPRSQSQQLSPEDEEVNNITFLLQSGRYEEGTIQWLQSAHQDKLFDRLFYRVNPPYLAHLSSPLIALSCASVVSSDFSSHLIERLNWLDTAMNSVENYQQQSLGLPDTDLREVCPQVMGIITQRLQELYVKLNEDGSPASKELIPRIAGLARRAHETKGANSVGGGLTR